MNTTRKIHTTLGNLIASLTAEMSRRVPDEKKAYELVAVMLADLSSSNRALRRAAAAAIHPAQPIAGKGN